ncbi:hypothetical protein K461DRAFT_25260 [Myriangium duriaei CBS 260.36]|uniref:Rhodopsin domain-containing protein n=1 Tax=Myriangium duriaei CBS 260.36 TaxID=1168546 RepID=A0A9P4JF39_9PEZI|nr:hypothetical protein K461DRAFT_25260 [Myriangium duriaei CBS 260.36]
MASTVSTTADVTSKPTATWTGDPASNPATALVNIHIGLILSNYIVAFVLTTLCVSLRIYVRRVMIKEIALDDWILIAAQFAYISFIVFVIGFSLNIQINGMQDEFWLSFNLTAFWELPLGLTNILVRGAIATFFLRALPQYEHTVARIGIIATFWLYAVFMVIFTFINIFQCGDPLATSWEYSPPCLNYAAMEALPIVARVLTMVLDWVMTLVPVIVVVRSAMSRRDKITVVCIMVLAGAGSTLSILSIVYNSLGIISYPDTFPGWMVYTIFVLWENGAAILVVSLAAMRPLFQKIVDGVPALRPGFGSGVPVTMSTKDTIDHPQRPEADEINVERGFENNVVLLGKFEVNPPS